ncbi:MAG: hypothetical protein GKS00_12640 [Alphaproteobacteria bacterium]|nr:hypothetical protein [Alphaproteobacteria bacterium]
MSSNQSSAALTGALLANKGAAAPSDAVSALLEEFPKPKPSKSNGPFSAKRQKPSVVRAIDRTVVGASCPVACSDGIAEPGQRAKLSLRLDQNRHLRLKLAAAHLRRSSQTIMLEALDAYLVKVAPSIGIECACLNNDG